MIKPTNKITGKLNASIIHVYPELENIEITPTVEDQTYTPTKYGFEEVKVKGVQPYIDEDIKPEYIKDGVDILGVIGNVVELQGEEKTISPSTTQQIIVPSDGKNGITRLTIEAVDSSIDENIKPENIKEGTNILGVDGQYRGIDTSDATATAEDILTGKTAYVNGAKIEGTLIPAEDLQEQLDAQDLVIQQLQEELAGKAQASAKPNIFVQLSEPENKNGIWVQSDLEYEVIDDCPVFQPVGHMSKNISSGGFCRIDNWLYILGGYWFNPETKKGETTARCFKINLDTYEEVELADWIGRNNKTYDMMCANIGNKIYMSTGNDTSPVIYIYNVDSDTWERHGFKRPSTSTGSPGKGYSLYSYNDTLYLLFFEGIYQVDTTTFELTELAIIDGARFTYESKPTAYNATGSQVLITGSYYVNNFPSIIFDFDTLNANRLVLDFKDHAAVFAVSNLASIFSFSGRNTLKNYVTEVYQYKNPLMGSGGNNRIIGKFPMQFSSYAWCYYNNYVYIFGGFMDTPFSSLSTSRVDSIYKISLDLSRERASNTIVLNDITRSIKQFNVELVDGIYTQLTNIGIYEDSTYNANRNVYIGTGTEWIQILGGEE